MTLVAFKNTKLVKPKKTYIFINNNYFLIFNNPYK